MGRDPHDDHVVRAVPALPAALLAPRFMARRGAAFDAIDADRDRPPHAAKEPIASARCRRVAGAPELNNARTADGPVWYTLPMPRRRDWRVSSEKKKSAIRAAKTPHEALERLKGSAIVSRSSHSPQPLKPFRVPGLHRAMKEVRRER